MKGDDLKGSLKQMPLGMPRFDDGMENIPELIQIMAESLANEVMEAQTEDAYVDVSPRNGYRGRALVATA